MFYIHGIRLVLGWLSPLIVSILVLQYFIFSCDKAIVLVSSVFAENSVSKEWIFDIIMRGAWINPADWMSASVDASEDESDEMDDSSTVLSIKLFPKKLSIQISGSITGKRTQKKHNCVYCDTLQSKLYRHLSTKHASEIDVARALAFPVKSKERKRAWLKVAALGDFLHNSAVNEKGHGILIPKYRPASHTEKKYLPCEYCRGHFVSTDLWKHHKSCPAKPDGVKSDGPQQNARLLEPLTASRDFNKGVLCKMRDDEVTCTVKSDKDILAFGIRQYEKTGKSQCVSQRIRELGRLSIGARKQVSSIRTLRDCVSSSNWEDLLLTIKAVAGYNIETKQYKTPSYALKVGHSLKKCARMIRNKSSQSNDDMTREDMIKFIELYTDEYGERIGHHALDTLNTMKYNTVKCLPLAEDVQKFSKYLDAKLVNATDCHHDHDSNEQYTQLTKLCLAKVILFNRRRAGEAQHLQVSSYLKASVNATIDKDVRKSLSKFEQKLCDNHLRVETRGKKGRKVAILLTNEMKHQLDIIISLREELGITSIYIFAARHSIKPYRGSDVVREFALEAELKYPNRLTSTSLRKQLGTMAQILSLTESSQDTLAGFMGHDLHIHRSFYRLPESALEVARVSKVLHAINSGNISEIAGKDLDEIDQMESIGTCIIHCICMVINALPPKV